MFKNVLFPIDQNRETRDAVAIVSNIVKTYGSKLFLLSVIEKFADDDSIMSDQDTVAQLLAGAKELFAQENIDAETIEREGMASFLICDVADEVEANLIIMGCRGLGLTQEGAEDSVTNRVINLAPCPVLVVP
ncbi:universal stress protein [Geminocystis sp. GBBB08]|uniref:universal stress protein n=1 Tax=Geminocystis sp. GBBB08 TaxID=2604140 RepID=UPI0027E24EE6|nr:universal stress protein [Geminocystis sp. GBBB08]MBL1209606.1 universal stress protein [Geminocystis sp. GBBB08]